MPTERDLIGYYELFLIHPWPCAAVLLTAGLTLITLASLICKRPVIHVEFHFAPKPVVEKQKCQRTMGDGTVCAVDMPCPVHGGKA
jgi:hypothetical protein